MALELKRVVETNLRNKNKLALYKPLLHLYSHLKQLYISNTMECLSYKGGRGVHVSRCLKEELDCAKDKRLWIISNHVKCYPAKKLINKVVLIGASLSEPHTSGNLSWFRTSHVRTVRMIKYD